MNKSIKSGLKRLHLYLALSFGSIFVVLGLSGSILAWMEELDLLLNPTLLTTERASETAKSITPLMVQAALDKLEKDDRFGPPKRLTIPSDTTQVIIAWYTTDTKEERTQWQQAWSRQVMIDPISLSIKGERNWGEYGLSAPLLIPTLHHFHRYLMLGEIGKTIIAISGLLLILMSLSGLVLWVPKAKWSAWRQAFTVNWHGSIASINFRLHRVVAIAALPILLILGFSGSYFNQPKWISPIIASFFPITDIVKLDTKKISTVVNNTPHTFISASQAMQSALLRFPNARVSRLGLPSDSAAVYEIRLRQPNEPHRRDGASKVTVDAFNGQILRSSDPLRGQSGDVILTWLYPLHSGIAFGAWGQIFISLFGLLPLVLMITGWHMWRKRSR
jgi:uncharacterized iron-regulated membrane protein